MVLPNLEATDWIPSVVLKVFIFVVINTTVYLAYSFIRSKFLVNVECWFCITRSRVKYIDKNSWICTRCEQYNGFNPDGSYNKTMERQSAYNARSFCQRSSNLKYESHRLCDKCNANQEIKIKLLSEFVPVNEDCFEKEVAEFCKNLDGLYKLCLDCEILISKVLDKPCDSTNNRKYNNFINDSFDPTSKAIFDNTTIDLKTIILRCFVNIKLILLLFYLFCISFHAFIFLNHESFFKVIISSDYVEIYEDYNVYLITLGFVFSSTQFYLETKKNNWVELLQLILWISLMTNNLNYNFFLIKYDNLIILHQRIYIILIVTSVLKMCYNLFTLILHLRSRKYSYSYGIKSMPEEVSSSVKTVKKANEAIRTIGKQIEELTLSESNGIANGDSWFGGFESNEPIKRVLSYQQIQHQNPVFKQQHFAYYYNFSNSNIYSSNIFASEWNNNSKLMHFKFDPIKSNGKLDEFSHRQENVELSDTDRSRPLSYSNVFHLFSLILTLVILFFIIVILSMPISVSFKNDFNIFNISISFVNPNINE